MATADIENVTTTADKFKLALALVLFLAGLGGFYTLGAQGVWVQWGVLLAALVAAVVVFLGRVGGREESRVVSRRVPPGVFRGQ